MRMKTLACCRRRPQDFSIDMDQEPDGKSSSHTAPPCLPNLAALFRAFAWSDFV
jgi:hypothetical protein